MREGVHEQMRNEYAALHGVLTAYLLLIRLAVRFSFVFLNMTDNVRVLICRGTREHEL